MYTSMATQLSAGVIESDRDTLVALKRMANYTAVNPAFGVQSLVELEEALVQAEEKSLLMQRDLAAARDEEIAAAQAFHQAIIGAKSCVIAQFGNDSSEVQAIGLKKRSDRKRPVRRKNGNTDS